MLDGETKISVVLDITLDSPVLEKARMNALGQIGTAQNPSSCSRG
jgi:hypothetical protein